ncbi:MAG: phenylacetate--CoA ligase family protein [Pseudomonas sp.]
MLTLEQLVTHVRQHSPYYAEHLKHLPEQGWKLHDIPVCDPATFWQNSEHLDTWPVLTTSIVGAHIFKTGGTTGQGKLAVYSRQEWHDFVQTFGRSLNNTLNAGDRVANLFYAGDLYASFIFLHDSLSHVEVPICEFPFTGAANYCGLTQALMDYQINVLAGVPAQLMRFATYLDEHQRCLPHVQSLLYGGESLFESQLPALRRVLPNARFSSIGYASVDAGLIGQSTTDCALGEHRVFDQHSLVEIIDEHTGEVIEQSGRSGRLVLTNLSRTLMPMLRYPVGDRAAWLEPSATAQRKFILLGRCAQSHRVRIAELSIFPDDLGHIIHDLAEVVQWQLQIDNNSQADLVTLKWVPSEGSEQISVINDALNEAVLQHYPGIRSLVAEGQLEWSTQACSSLLLSCNPKSGKLMRVHDLRSYPSSIMMESER